MRKFIIATLCVLGLGACDKHDPILPGVRTSIFDTSGVDVQNRVITDIPETVFVDDNSDCKYTQDSENVIWDGQRRVFSGFATPNSVSCNQRPVCSGSYVYAGLTTGELVKIRPSNRQVVWIADIFRASNLTGGASMVDIVAPIIPYGKYVYAGGLGDAFCKVSAATGLKSWCLDISVAVPFIMAGNYAFVVSADNNLYAVSITSGTVFWRASVSEQIAPEYSDGVITVGKQRFDVRDGTLID